MIACEWGEWGVRSLLPVADVFIIVDVLSFSTCVEIAVSRGATVWPYRWKDESARQFARAKGALLAGKRGTGIRSRRHRWATYRPTRNWCCRRRTERP